MPGDKSVYRKMHAVLEFANARPAGSPSQLAEAIKRKPPANFLYYREHDGEHKKTDSGPSIDRAVQLTVDLDLIDRDTGIVTKSGASALEPGKYDRVVGQCVKRYLEKEGTRFPELAVAIERRLLGVRPPVLPTADAIWSALGEPASGSLDADRFRSCLTLLGYCGLLSTSQRKTFMIP